MDEKKDLRDQLEELLERKMNKLSNMEEGSTEHSRLAEDIQSLYSQWLQEVKIDSDNYFRQVQLDNEKRRDEAEFMNKAKEIENDAKKHRRIRWDTILTCATVVGLTIGCCMFEANGHIFPMKLLKYADKLKFVV